ncbi:hypothetical protein [Herbaspirillum camelliae]|uniref:hypothetical protein n=1 Tax=Herbaspirillum camelliae TaxID=1892903 RepID=UPI00117A351B|nr:hypothetical protein [Herbaspirillum camelliae]
MAKPQSLNKRFTTLSRKSGSDQKNSAVDIASLAAIRVFLIQIIIGSNVFEERDEQGGDHAGGSLERNS